MSKTKVLVGEAGPERVIPAKGVGDFKVAIVIPHWSSPFLGETLKSCENQDATVEVVNTRERGWQLAKAWNYGAVKYLREQDYDAVVLSNDDVVMRDDTAQQLAYALLVHQFVEPAGDKELLLTTEYNTRHHPDVGPRWGYGCPDYSCFCVGRKYLDVVGLFDENFIPAYLEDNDSHTRIQRAGYQGAQWAPTLHHGSTTVNFDTERKAEVQTHGKFDANVAYYIKKWGGPQHRETFEEPFDGNPPEGWSLTLGGF